MSETHITLYNEKAEAFEAVKEQIGPEGVDPSNAATVMRLIEAWEDDRGSRGIPGGLTD